jgi:small subunit ribosomal protein S4
MARYNGPREKICRKLGQILPSLVSKKALKRTTPPGQHGASMRKLSEYGKRLKEKQILRYHYGIQERQLRKVFDKAKKRKGVTGEVFISLLEKRLDNVLWRAGFTPTTPAARQLVGHGHVLVNGQKVDIPSYCLKVGDEVSIREKSQKLEKVITWLSLKNHENAPKYLEVNPGAFTTKLKEEPGKEDLPIDVDIQLIVEYYARL